MIQATPYFFGSTDVTVLPNQQVKASIEASLANALLVPVVDESLQKHYSAWELTVKVGEESMRLASKENSNNHLYVKAGQSVTGLFNGTNLVGKETSTEWTMISETASRTQYTIQCNPDLSVFSNIQLMATATHIYDNGSLTGTEVILSLAANGAPVEAVASWDIKVLYNGETIRTYSNTPTNATMNVSDGWPYVPQGSTLSASISLKSGDIVDLPSVSMATIPLPTFTATVSGSTSYSVYKSSGATAANERDGSSIFDISSSVNISSNILDNTNYSNLLKVTYTTDGGGNSGELPYGSVGTLSGLAWQKHALTATVIFDGVTDKSAPVDCHITGLPCKAAPPTNGEWRKEEGTVVWNSDHVRLGNASISQPHAIVSNGFHVPENIDVKVETKYQVSGATVGTTFTLYLGTNTLFETKVGFWGNQTKESSIESTVTSSNNYIKCNNSYGSGSTHSKVYYVNVIYR